LGPRQAAAPRPRAFGLERPPDVPKVPRLRELRELAALSQEELAQQAQVSRATIARAELGKITPHGRTVRRLARALGVAPADLMVPPTPTPPTSPPASHAEPGPPRP
jgi:transcriptional regulator with XRE-family HTH domain